MEPVEIDTRGGNSSRDLAPATGRAGLHRFDRHRRPGCWKSRLKEDTIRRELHAHTNPNRQAPKANTTAMMNRQKTHELDLSRVEIGQALEPSRIAAAVPLFAVATGEVDGVL